MSDSKHWTQRHTLFKVFNGILNHIHEQMQLQNTEKSEAEMHFSDGN